MWADFFLVCCPLRGVIEARDDSFSSTNDGSPWRIGGDTVVNESLPDLEILTVQIEISFDLLKRAPLGFGNEDHDEDQAKETGCGKHVEHPTLQSRK